MHPKDLLIEDFTYNLPDNRIAKFPLAERDRSKLLVYHKAEIETSVYENIAEFLPEGSLLVFNNTKVVEARLLFQKPTGAVIEVFCLEPEESCRDITTAMSSKGRVLYKCLIGGASKWKHGMKLVKEIGENERKIVLEAVIADRLSDCFIIELSWTPTELTFAEVLHAAGTIPLPPYLHRDAEESDKKTYQTIYAKHDGSVAAPTAGLHFTEAIFERLEAKNIRKDFVTLHVGAGTFKPVKSEKLEGHEMHTEFIEVSLSTVKLLIEHLNKTIVAVGTTSLRTVESLYWLGLRIMSNTGLTAEELGVHQWDPYEVKSDEIKADDALKALVQWMEQNNTEKLITKTQILIAPTYQLKVAKALVTNFHQPQSTLLLLIAAIVGNDWKKIYEYAMDNDFRFLSYGDGCLLFDS